LAPNSIIQGIHIIYEGGRMVQHGTSSPDYTTINLDTKSHELIDNVILYSATWSPENGGKGLCRLTLFTNAKKMYDCKHPKFTAMFPGDMKFLNFRAGAATDSAGAVWGLSGFYGESVDIGLARRKFSRLGVIWGRYPTK